MLSLFSELVEPGGTLQFCSLMEIVSLINYLHLLGNQLPPACVMPSGNGQSLAINNWLLSSAGRFWASDLLIRESGSHCCCCPGLQCGIQCAYSWGQDYCVGHSRSQQHPIHPPVYEECSVCTHQVNQAGVESPSQLGTISVWSCPRSLGNPTLCSHSRLVLNSPAYSLKSPGKAFLSRGLTLLEFSCQYSEEKGVQFSVVKKNL